MDREHAERERLLRGFGKERAPPWASLEIAEHAERRPIVGKSTLSERLPPARRSVQRKLAAMPAIPDAAQIDASAQRGIATATSPLPYADRLQRLFGRHDISTVKAHTGANASASARAMGAAAYATGDHVVLGEGADLHTVAHEVAHVVQQRGSVQLLGGIGAIGDAYERHADAVAERVVRGESAESLLDEYAPGGGAGAASATPIQRMVLVLTRRGVYQNLDVQPGEKAVYDVSIPDDRRAVEAHWAREQLLREEEDQRRAQDESEEADGWLLAQDQLLVAGPRDQFAGDQHGQGHVPDVAVNFGGNEYLDPRGDIIVASSKTIDLHASWTPGPQPPDGHTPNAVVGWVQNVVFHNKQADYFDLQDKYVESSFKEHNRPVIDGDDPGSPWYDPPRPYQEVRSAQMLQLCGGKQPTGARGIPLSDKPQDVFPMVSPKGGLLYRFGGETRLLACLVMMEPDGSRPTVLEWIAWKYEYGYTLRTVAPKLRNEGYQRPTVFHTLYADTYVTGRAAGTPPCAYNLTVTGAQGNVFFEQMRPSWEEMPRTAGNPYDESRFPSFI